MAKNILIIGKSGSGKTTSLRNLNDKDYALINPLGKALPFRSDKKYLETFSYEQIKSALLAYVGKGVKNIFIDDAGYLLTNALMTMGSKDQYKHFRDMATDFYELIRFITKELPEDVIVGLFMHEESDDLGNVKVKTVGKMLDNQVTIEGMFTTVIRALKTTDGHKFQTQGDSANIVKAPMGMFEEQYIDNDMKIVLEIIREYYNMEEVVNE